MAKALYYNENREGKELEIIAANKEAGTVDLGVIGEDKKPVVLVRGCKVVTEATIGCASLVAEAKAAKTEEAPKK